MKSQVNKFSTLYNALILIYSLLPPPPPQAGLKPADPVDVLYRVSGDPGPAHSLQEVITAHKEHIVSVTKGPLLECPSGGVTGRVLAEEDQKVSKVDLH